MRRLNTFNIIQVLVMCSYLILVTLSPSIHFIQYISFHDCQRVIQLLLLSFVLIEAMLSIFSPNQNQVFEVNSKLKLSFVILLIIGIISAYMSIEPRYAFIEISLFAALSYLSLFVAKSFLLEKNMFIKYLTYAFLVSILLYMVSFYVGYATAMAFRKPLEWPAPFSGFSNIRLFQEYQLWSLGLICLPLLAFELKQKIRLWLYFSLSCWWILLFYAASRGVTLSWLLAMSLTAIVYRKLAWPFLRLQLITSGFGLAGYFILFKGVPSWITSITSSNLGNSPSTILTSTIFRNTTYDRIDLWKAAYEMIINFPFLGVGPMNFYFHNRFGTNPHNSLLQIAAEWGLPASLLIWGVLGFGFYCWYKKFNSNKLKTANYLDCNLSIILFFTIIANGAYSLVEGVIVMPISQVLMFTIFGLMIGQYKYGQLASDNLSKIRIRPIFASFVLVIIVFTTLPELIRGLTSYERYFVAGEMPFSTAPHTINPRIWMQQRRIEPEVQKPQENKDTN